MKMKNMLLVLAIMLFLFAITGCNLFDDIEEDVTVTAIEIDKENLEDAYEAGEFNFFDLRLRVIFNDGSTETVAVSEAMVTQADLEKLHEPGEHEITVTYEGLRATFTVSIVSQADALTVKLMSIYDLAVNAEVFDGTYEEWLETVSGPKGEPGEDGREVVFKVADDYLQWKYEGDEEWTNLIELISLVGPKGDTGQDGIDGKEVTFQVSENYIQWQYLGDTEWINLVELASLTGSKGEPGEDGIGIAAIELEADGVLSVELTDGTIERLHLDLPTAGMSAYEIYRKHHPGYEEDELAWLEALLDGTLMYAPASLALYTYETRADGTIFITSYTGDETHVVIPDWIAGYTVAGIADGAFADVAGIEEITIPEGIMVIDEKAFAGMTDLRWLHIPISVTNIGANALENTTDVSVMTDHEQKPDGWHTDWNPEDHVVGWFIVFDYHAEYYEVITTQFLTMHAQGVDVDGEPFEQILKRSSIVYYYDFGEEIIILTQDYPVFYMYEICPLDGCYTSKTTINHDQYTMYNDEYFEYTRNLLYASNLEDFWLERTIQGYRIKEAYLEEAGQNIYPGLILYEYEIAVDENGFSIHASMHAPPLEINQPEQVIQTFTDIGTTPSINIETYEPCGSTVEELPSLGVLLETENVTLNIYTHYPETHHFREELRTFKLTESATERTLHYDGTEEGPPMWTYLVEEEETSLWYSSYYNGYDPETGTFEEFGWENPTEENTVLNLYIAELEGIGISDYNPSWFLEFEVGQYVLLESYFDDMLVLLGEDPESGNLEMFEIRENGEDITIIFMIYDQNVGAHVTKVHVFEDWETTHVSPPHPPE